MLRVLPPENTLVVDKVGGDSNNPFSFMSRANLIFFSQFRAIRSKWLLSLPSISRQTEVNVKDEIISKHNQHNDVGLQPLSDGHVFIKSLYQAG
ncbi:hypothetical protein [Zavarzinella formosa]|uniref:hypothetical protein n=1 Tax=Zavarzinella formosa TaxID=360055 RepID=UPI0012FCC81A|nr:hypothetical protein [Zavarzinella formosa]